MLKCSIVFVIVDKVRARGEDVRRCRCDERQRAKTGGWLSLTRTRGSGGMGHLSLRRGKSTGDERLVSGRVSVYSWEDTGSASMLRLIHRVVALVMMLLTFDLS